ncbi:MAG TPA: GNAT family N-acetyltransferase, partial [Proteiniclasticum sp.]|nr:GNAT family N-acetyltransferase [Proteiniclasticum sp.]
KTMEILISGEIHKAIQIGTVMTEKGHRGQGLASRLMEKVLEDFNEEYSVYFLAADEKAVPLYERFGFSPVKTERFILETSSFSKREKPLVSEPMSIEDLLEYKRASLPLSTKFSAIGDEHILVFYYVHGFDRFIYKLSDDILVLFEMEENELHLYDIFSKKKVDLKEIIEKILPLDAEKVIFHFIPDGNLEGLRTEEDPEAGWMIRILDDSKLPEDLAFPDISKA